MTKEKIIDGLRQVLLASYSPYSNIKVAAAIKYQRDGDEFVEYGTNVENISYGLTNCAERTAVFSAITSGMKNIDEVYIMSNFAEYMMPCGACRQVIAEFIADPNQVNVICLNKSGDEKIFKFSELLPYSFK
jgi:cytidine deaminase